MQRREFLLAGSRAAAGFSALFLSGCSSGAPQTGADRFFQALVAEWETAIPQWLRDTKMPAVSIAVIRNGQLAWQRAFGVKDTGTNEPVETNTLFAACSNTKPVFAYGVLKLCEQGLLDLDTPLTKYTTRRVSQDARIELITARHVLNHTTGFPNWRQASDLPIEFTPGTKYQYSGEGFSYLQSVVLELTDQSFDEFMRDRILSPLAMTSSLITWNMDDVRQIAKPHDDSGRRIAGKYFSLPTATEREANIERYGAAAMLMTTPTDYAKFLLEFLTPKSGDRFRPSEASRKEMLRPQVRKPEGASEGLAWALEEYEGATVFSHSGQDAGYYCFAAGSTDRRSGLMVMLNGDTYVPFLLKMLADPAGPSPKVETIWPDFAKRFFAG